MTKGEKMKAKERVLSRKNGALIYWRCLHFFHLFITSFSQDSLYTEMESRLPVSVHWTPSNLTKTRCTSSENHTASYKLHHLLPQFKGNQQFLGPVKPWWGMQCGEGSRRRRWGDKLEVTRHGSVHVVIFFCFLLKSQSELEPDPVPGKVLHVRLCALLWISRCEGWQ